MCAGDETLCKREAPFKARADLETTKSGIARLATPGEGLKR